VLALYRQRFPSFVGDAIAAAAALPRPLHPAAPHQLTRLEAIERRVERGQREPERALAAALEPAGDLIPMQRFVLDQRQDDQIGAALLRRVEGAAIGWAGSY